jgi:hypothetical protein
MLEVQQIPFDPEVAPQMCGPFSIASRGDLGTRAVRICLEIACLKFNKYRVACHLTLVKGKPRAVVVKMPRPELFLFSDTELLIPSTPDTSR